MSQLFTPDIGHANFASAWGKYSLGDLDDFASSQLARLDQALQSLKTFEEGSVFRNDTFSLQQYYWSDCTCGYQAQENEWHNAHPHTETCLDHRHCVEHAAVVARGATAQEIRQHMLDWSRNATGGKHDDCSMMCDCGVDDAFNEWTKSHTHQQDCRLIMPNFSCGDFQIYWYKHIGRGMSCNRPTSHEELVTIFARCMQSLA